MPKIGRNEPCPCGSGKKYKKCCGANAAPHYDETAVNHQLYKVHGDLISYVNDKYDSVIEQQLDTYNYDLLKDEDKRTVYKSGITPWIVLKEPLLKNGLTILQACLDNEKASLSLPARQKLLDWMEQKPSIYEVQHIDKPNQGFVEISDIRSSETHIIPYQEASDFQAGDLLMGILVPFIGHDNFLFTMLRLFHGEKSQFETILRDNSDFADLLLEAIQKGIFSEEWLQPSHEEVADLFADYMDKRNVKDKLIVDGIMLWNKYCQLVNPSIQKAGPHAAGFTYYFEKNVLNNTHVKQMEVADQFGTSASSLSSIYRRIVKELESDTEGEN